MKRALQLVCLIGVLMASQVGAIDKINLLLGEQKTLEVNGVSKVSVGDGTVLKVTVLGANELLLSGLATGLTTMTIWNTAGQKETLTVEVYAVNPEDVRRELEALLTVEGTPIEGVQVRVIGDRVVIDGQVFKEGDVTRVEAVAKMYKSVTNLTTFNKSYNQIKRMVQLDFHFYEMRRDDTASIGVNWADIVDPSNGTIIEATYTKPVGSDLSSGGDIKLINSFNPIRLRGDYQGNRLLHHHKVVVRSGETAHYLEGGKIYLVAAAIASQATIQEEEFGFIVEATVDVDKADNVLLKIDIEFSVPDSTLSQDLGGFPTFQKRGVETSVNLPLGKTVMLSGFLTETFGRRALGIPGLSKLPVLGALFGSQGFTEQQTDGVLFVTPTIVRGVGDPKEDPFVQGVVDRYHADRYRSGAGSAGDY